MKFILTIALCLFLTQVSSKALGGYEVKRKLLEVPVDPSTWVYQGKEDVNGLISNGNQATDTQFPWTVEMSINLQSGGLLCTASIISNRWILGARHCIADTNAVSVRVSMGSADRQANRLQVFSDVIVWLNSPTGRDHPDIAVFRLTQVLSFTSFIRDVRLPARSQANWSFEGHTMTASGWGGVGGGALSRFLQWANFRILPTSQCDFGIYFCSQPPSGSASLEGGDSGGPSVIYEGGIPTLIGINVFVASSGSNRWQGSTRVSLFLDFISSETGIPIRN